MTCPKCKSERIKHFESWAISFDHKVTEPPASMWACLNPTCLHKWRREASELTPQMERLSMR
jgi:hypothetical protein